MYRVAIIGVGRGGPTDGSHSIGYIHAQAYRAVGTCALVGAAARSAENVNRFAQAFNVPYASTDYRTMLAEVRPDVVSVATYANAFPEIVEACIAAGVRGIWCEKPFCLTINAGRAMVEACRRSDVKLIVNHQRRYLHIFREARRLLQAGAIGAPVAFLANLPEGGLMEWGIHWLDMFRFFAGDQPAQWVLGQVHCSGARRRNDHVMEEHGAAYIGFADGTRALLESGLALNGPFSMRLSGTEGLIDLYEDGRLRVLDGSGWGDVPVHSTMHWPLPSFEAESPWPRILKALLAWMEGGPEPEVAGQNALLSSELYLAAYESAMRCDRVDLPLSEQTVFPLDAIAARRSGGDVSRECWQ